mmetsp:Transcript_10792/g.22289  ORF Transcript_10792/g.22289 Transcript_10792/m.22289 type:complete len:84 (-) Transcript_10792:104-355(-)
MIGGLAAGEGAVGPDGFFILSAIKERTWRGLGLGDDGLVRAVDLLNEEVRDMEPDATQYADPHGLPKYVGLSMLERKWVSFSV